MYHSSIGKLLVIANQFRWTSKSVDRYVGISSNLIAVMTTNTRHLNALDCNHTYVQELLFTSCVDTFSLGAFLGTVGFMQADRNCHSTPFPASGTCDLLHRLIPH